MATTPFDPNSYLIGAHVPNLLGGAHVPSVVGPAQAPSPWSPQAPAHPSLIPARVSGSSHVDITRLPVNQQQSLLRHAGYDVAVDGIAGPQTKTALNAYLKGTPANVWNHAWQNSHTPQATAPVPGGAPAATAAAPAATTARQTQTTTQQPSAMQLLLQSVLGNQYQPPSAKETAAALKQMVQASLQPQLVANAQQRKQAILDSQLAQQQALADAQRNARFEQGVSAALAGVLKGQGPATEAAYHQAAQDTGALAQGFSDQLRGAATASADQANAILAANGAPAGQMLDPAKGAAGADVLYGLGGYIPGTTLAQQGAAFTGAANQLPATAVGRGQQLSADALRAGSDQRADLRSQELSDLAKIRGDNATIQASRAGITQAAANQLQTQQTQAAALAQNNALLPLILADKFESLPGVNPLTGKPTKPTRDANAAAAKTRAENKPRFSGSNTATLHYKADQFGNPWGGRLVPQPGWVINKRGELVKGKSPSTARGKVKLSRAQQIALSTADAGVASKMKNGGKDADGNDLAPIPYEEAVARFEAQGRFADQQSAAIALNALWSVYGRPGAATVVSHSRPKTT